MLAREGVRFDDAVSPAPVTLVAHVSILTGLDPDDHGVRHNGQYRLDPAASTLAETLKQNGYETAAFVSGFVLDARYGLAQGFDRYDDRTETLSGTAVRRPGRARRPRGHGGRARMARGRGANEALLRLGALLRPSRGVQTARRVRPEASPPLLTMARSPTWIRRSGGSSKAWSDVVRTSWSSSPETTARASGSTPSIPTPVFSMSPPSAYPFSSGRRLRSSSLG